MLPAQIVLTDGRAFNGVGLATILQTPCGMKSPVGQVAVEAYGDLEDAIEEGASLDGASVSCFVWHQGNWSQCRWVPQWGNGDTPDTMGGGSVTVIYFDGGNPFAGGVADPAEVLEIYRRRLAWDGQTGSKGFRAMTLTETGESLEVLGETAIAETRYGDPQKEISRSRTADPSDTDIGRETDDTPPS